MSERLDTLARRVVDKRETKDRTAADAKTAKEAYENAESDFWTMMEDLGLKTFTQDLGEGYGEVQFQRRETIRGIILDKETAAAAIEEMGLADALQGLPEVQQAALSEHVRDWMAAGQRLPAGIDFTAKRFVSITRR